MILASGCNRGNFVLERLDVERTDRKMNGNKDGITTLMHISKPPDAPAKAVLESNINNNIAIIGSNVYAIRLCLIRMHLRTVCSCQE